MKGRPAVLLVIIVIAFAALWPALLNGGPFYMADTPSYFRGAASVLFKVLHIKTEWTAEFLRLYQGDAAPAASAASSSPAAAITTGNDGPVTLNGRSVYYGLLLYLGYLAGSVWIIALAQSLLAATALVLTVGLIGRSRGVEVHPAAMLTIGLVTALGTSLGYFSGYLMPDLFTGLTVLAVSNLLFLSPWQSASEKLFWSATLAYSLLVHSTNLMLCTAIVLLWVVYATLRKPRANLRPLIGVGACIGIGVLGQLAFGIGVKAETGHPPVRPPFIAMRLIADGPGYSYLQKHCGTEHFIYCQTLAHPRLPSDTLLWSADPHVSLFRGLPANGQRASAAQQKKFVAAVLAERPFEVLTTAARNSIAQLLSFDLINFNYSDDNRERFEKTIPPRLPQLHEADTSIQGSHADGVRRGRNATACGRFDSAIRDLPRAGEGASSATPARLLPVHFGRNLPQRCDMRRIIRAKGALSNASHLDPSGRGRCACRIGIRCSRLRPASRPIKRRSRLSDTRRFTNLHQSSRERHAVMRLPDGFGRPDLSGEEAVR